MKHFAGEHKALCPMGSGYGPDGMGWYQISNSTSSISSSFDLVTRQNFQTGVQILSRVRNEIV